MMPATNSLCKQLVSKNANESDEQLVEIISFSTRTAKSDFLKGTDIISKCNQKLDILNA